MLLQTLAENHLNRALPDFFPASQFIVIFIIFIDASSISDDDFQITAAPNLFLHRFSCMWI